MSLQHTNQHGKRLRALYHLSVELSALRNLESVLKTALKHCLELTDSQFGFIGLVADNGEEMDVVEVQGFHASEHFYQRFRLIPLRPNIFSRVVLEDTSIRSEDVTIDPHRVGQPKGHPPVETFLGVPLRYRDHPMGMIGLANRSEPYNEEHEHLLMTYAAQIAIVICNAQLYEELTATKSALEQTVIERTQELQQAKEVLAQKAAQLQLLYNETVDIQETERQRIAQDMHDGINQLLIGAMLELKSARQRFVLGNHNQVDDSLQSVQSILYDVEAEIKRVIYDLRPPTLDTLGFVPTLRRYIQDFKQYANLNCQLTIKGKIKRLAEHAEVNIYRFLQEALQNVLTHAQATQVDVIIHFKTKKLTMMVIDDGAGFDMNQINKDNRYHFGLITMQERAKSLEGNLTIETQPGQGTCVTLCIPICDIS